MANVTLMGASYSDVPSILLPQTGGGQCQFFEVSGSQTATSNGTYDVSALAQMIVSVTGGGGLVYETGTWSPSSDIARGEVSFSNTHTNAPFLICLSDATGTAHSATNSNYGFIYFDPWQVFSQGYPYSSSGFRYANAYYIYRSSDTTKISASGLLITNKSSSTTSSSTAYPKYWATNTKFMPYSNSTSRYWRSGRSFKWYAIWK